MQADDAGLLNLLERHGAALLALFTRLTLRLSVAEDLLQDLFLKLRHAPGFRRAKDPKAYAFRTAINLAFDWRRAQRPSEPLRDNEAAPTESPLDRIVDSEDLDIILDAMNDLSDLGRQIIVLRYLQQRDYAEIAAEVGKTEHQVRGLCYKALEQLRTLIKPIEEAQKQDRRP